jgi:Fe-S cluster assembly iron-binding protein IscA/alpha/beta superfamily hydrolase
MNHFHCFTFAVVMLIGCSKAQQPAQRPTERPSLPTAKVVSPPPMEKAGNSPQKNFVALTPAAAAQLRKLMKELKGKQYLRVSVSDDYQYKLDLDPVMDPKGDYLGESRGIPVVADRKSSQFLPPGITVDYVDGPAEKGFKFSAPEADQTPPDTSVSLAEARRGFKTTLARRESGGEPPPEPPANLFRLVRYDAPPGKLAAYLTLDPKDGKKHPAIVWITGGDCNSIGPCWREGDSGNDQSASAYRKAGIVMMFPSLRGGNGNPGVKEGFLGEVDDVLAAADFLRKQPFVDPERVYLGGHSTGATLVLLTGEYSGRFRAVFSFGPTNDVIGYGPRYVPCVLSDPKELQLRAPGRWLHSIRSPVFVIEGTGGNLSALQTMARSSKNPNVRFFEIKGADHFDLLATTNRLIAARILQDTGPKCSLSFTEAELNKSFAK